AGLNQHRFPRRRRSGRPPADRPAIAILVLSTMIGGDLEDCGPSQPWPTANQRHFTATTERSPPVAVIDGSNLFVPGCRDLAPSGASRSKPAEVFPPAHCQNNLDHDRFGLFSLAPVLRLPGSRDFRQR